MSKFDEIKVPKNIKEETRKTIEKGRKIKQKNKLKALKVASITILTISASLALITPSIAGEIPFLNSMFKGRVLKQGSSEDMTLYVKELFKTRTVNGTSFTIDEILCDGHRLYISYTIKSENKLPRQDEGFYKDKMGLDVQITLKNGTATKDSETIEGYIDDYTYKGMLEYSLSFYGKKAPKKIKVNFIVDNIYTNESNSEKIDTVIEGPFNFKLNLIPNTEIEEIDVNETKEDITIESLEITPFTVCVNVSFPQELIKDSNDNNHMFASLGGKFFSNLAGKSFGLDNNYKVKNGRVYDSIVVGNVYKLGYYHTNDYLKISFKKYNNGLIDNITEFKINIGMLE